MNKNQQATIEPRKISKYDNIMAEATWQTYQNEEADLDIDLQCLLLNDIGELIDAVYYNQLDTGLGEIKLQGDHKGIQNQETIIMRLDSLSYQVRYLAIILLSNEGKTFSKVEKGTCLITANGKQLTSVSLEDIGAQNSYLCCIFSRGNNDQFLFWDIQQGGMGQTFLECDVLVQKNLAKTGFDELLFLESSSWTGKRCFNLKKNTVVMIPKNTERISVGLGWQTKKCDMDSNVILMSQTLIPLEIVSFRNLIGRNESVIHKGDKLDAGQGDNEVIDIYFNRLDKRVQYIWIVITIFSKGHTFADVDGAFCRLFDENKRTLCYYNLSENKDGISTGCIMCCIEKYKESWGIQSKEYFVKDVQVAQEMVERIKQLCRNDFKELLSINYSEHPKISIRVSQGEGIIGYCCSSAPDTYVVIKNNNKIIGRTNKVVSSPNPVWNFYGQCDYQPDGNVIEIMVYESCFFHDFVIGTRLHKNIGEINKRDNMQHQVEKISRNNQEFGQIYYDIEVLCD